MPRQLRIFIVDDEAPARARLRALLADSAEVLPHVVVGEADSGGAALKALASVPVDVVLLDIRMPGMDGLELARHLGAHGPAPAIIFVTAYDTHAVKAFEVQARDYLVKPVRRERLVESLKRVQAALGAEAEKAMAAARTHFTVNDRGRVLRVPVDEVLYLRAELKYVTLRSREREYVLDESLVKLEEEFPRAFVRIHRRCLVNRAYLKGFEMQRQGEESHWVAILRDWAEKLPVSRRQSHVVREFRDGTT